MEKKFDNGLVLGKYFPVTLGHLHLINSALQKCKDVYVMVCSLKSEKIPGDVRFGWLKEIYQNNKHVHIIHCTDENPQHPEECKSIDEFYNKYWVPTVYNRIAELDCVFTSESYGEEFAHYLGIKHILVDIERKTFPISGTKVRANPYENWDLIPPQVQKYYQKKIVIIGPESTGKSTIVERLAKEYDCPFVEEYGRTYVETVPTKDLIEWDFEMIAVLHADKIRRAQQVNKKMFLFVDTDALTTLTFANMYLKRKINNKMIELVIEDQQFDLVFLLDTSVPHINDGTRDFSEEKDRIRHFELIRGELNKHKVPHIIIRGTDYEERYQKIVNKIEKLKKS